MQGPQSSVLHRVEEIRKLGCAEQDSGCRARRPGHEGGVPVAGTAETPNPMRASWFLSRLRLRSRTSAAPTKLSEASELVSVELVGGFRVVKKLTALPAGGESSPLRLRRRAHAQHAKPMHTTSTTPSIPTIACQDIPLPVCETNARASSIFICEACRKVKRGREGEILLVRFGGGV